MFGQGFDSPQLHGEKMRDGKMSDEGLSVKSILNYLEFFDLKTLISHLSSLIPHQLQTPNPNPQLSLMLPTIPTRLSCA